MIDATTSKVGGGTTPVMKRSSSRLRNIFYWITTVYIALAMFVGGFSEVFDASMNIELSSIGIATVVAVLGYPLYFVYIIGIAKILGAIVIIVPKFVILYPSQHPRGI